MKQNLLKSMLVVSAVIFAQGVSAGTYYFYNKSTQFEAVLRLQEQFMLLQRQI